MRMQHKNKVQIRYALQFGTVTVYEKDADGNIIYDTIDGEQVARETGDRKLVYNPAVELLANINFTGQSEVLYEAYGISKADFDATIYTDKDATDMDETSIVFVDSEPVYDGDYVDPDSADYRVVRVIHNLNHDVFLLKAVNS